MPRARYTLTNVEPSKGLITQLQHAIIEQNFNATIAHVACELGSAPISFTPFDGTDGSTAATHVEKKHTQSTHFSLLKSDLI